jgi:hypothetical protein
MQEIGMKHKWKSFEFQNFMIKTNKDLELKDIKTVEKSMKERRWASLKEIIRVHINFHVKESSQVMEHLTYTSKTNIMVETKPTEKS